MPLRQSQISFGKSPSTSSITPVPTMPSTRPTVSRTETSSTIADEDTIVVDTSRKPSRKNPLPTPSDSATDISSESSQTLHVKKVPQGKGRRVAAKTRQSIDAVLEAANEKEKQFQSRSISGETLVTSTASQSTSSLLQSGITALNLPWSMSSVFGNGSKGDLVRNEKEMTMSVDSLETVRNDDEEDDDVETEEQRAEREAKAAAKRAVIERNAKLREARWKAADAKATKRSSRVSVLGKVSELATSVLGKRSRDALDKGMDMLTNRGGARPQSMIVSATTPVFEGPMSKKRRLSESDAKLVEASIPTKKQIIQRKNKRWLNSGLYAGQSRAFNPCLTESKNKKKQSSKPEEPERENKVLPLPMFAGDRLLRQGRNFKLPFDIFSPLPAGQPKPDEWRKVNKNVFVGDSADYWRISKFQEHSTCVCRVETGCDEDCLNRFMYYECDETNCNLTEEECGNRAFEGLRQRVKKGGKYNVGVEVVKTVDRGNGVRSNRTFDANQIIVEYTGEILTQEECESRMRTLYKDNECYYLMLFDQNMIIDATRGSIARFVNHSCEPNCRMEKWTVGGKPRMALFAGDRGIMTGEELTYDYNFDPYSQKNVQECRCGAKTCRGVLGPKPKDKPKEKEEGTKEGKLAGAKRKIAAVLDESTSKLNKKRKVTAVVEAKVYSPNGKASLVRVTKKVALAKKPSKGAINRRPSKLRRMIEGTKEPSSGKRVASGASGEALLAKGESKVLGRKQSVKEKAAGVGKSVMRSVRGR